MKKILIPIEANKELPKTSNNYPTFVGISFTELYFNAVDKTWYCPLTPEDVPTNNEVLWYKEVSEEEYLKQKLAHAKNEVFLLWHDGEEWMVSRNGDPTQTKPLSEII